jgi:hypothetical protein
MRFFKSLSIAGAIRQNSCERDRGQYRFQTGHVWPHGIPLRTVEAPATPAQTTMQLALLV